jgi:Na+-translocating ferredoxin:NAD+ oxidoreductase RnfC subunit
MGMAQVNLDSVVIKAVSGIVSIAENDVDYKPERACIRCGRCNEVVQCCSGRTS